MSVEFQKVVSSNVHSVGHDPATSELHVRYTSKANDAADGAGDTYVYTGVTADEHLAMMGAPSVGVYLNRNIKPAHECKKLAPPTNREKLIEADCELLAALVQVHPEDDQIIVEHIRKSHGILAGLIDGSKTDAAGGI